MKKNWTAKKIHENAWGRHFTRWYIKSPNENFYLVYRGCFSNTIYLCRDLKDDKQAQSLGTSFNEAIQKVYEIEASGLYSPKLSDAIANEKECKFLYEQQINQYNYYSM